MYPDPEEILAVARALELRAEEIRTRARQVADLAACTTWQSHAGDAMRSEAAEVGRGMAAAVHSYLAAAGAVRRFAAEVAAAQTAIAEAEAFVRGVVARAAREVAAAASGAAQEATEAARRVADLPLPAPGGRDWLDVARAARDLLR